MNRLDTLLGSKPVSLPAISENLLGKPRHLALYEPEYMAVYLLEYLRDSDWWKTAGFEKNEIDFVQGMYVELAELFNSRLWKLRDHMHIHVLGHLCAEESTEELPPDWHAGWSPVASSLSWHLLEHHATGGVLYNTEFSSEGFNYSIWFYARIER